MNIPLKRAIKFISYCLRRPHQNGHGIHSPFLFDFVTKVVYKKPCLNIDLKNIKKLRKDLLKSKDTLWIDDFGAGSKQIHNKQRKISNIARFSSSSPKYGRLLYDIASSFKPEITIELGTCLGLGTMHLATGYETGKVITIEGSKALYEKANENFSTLGIKNILSRCGNFDDLLPDLLQENGKFDLAFIDGNHKKDAVIRYFNLCLPYAQSHSIIIFDDIRWSNDMLEAWLEICRNEKIKLSLDMFNLGIVFFNDKLIKQHFEVFY